MGNKQLGFEPEPIKNAAARADSFVLCHNACPIIILKKKKRLPAPVPFIVMSLFYIKSVLKN